MALFNTRTWYARLGLGLNKFIIGEKDANGKQTLTNSPDSVSQVGDVISADNLNDLELRISDGFYRVAERLTKVWENTSPSADFGPQPINIGNSPEFIIEYKNYKDDVETHFYHMKCPMYNNGSGELTNILINDLSTPPYVQVDQRSFAVQYSSTDGPHHNLVFYDCKLFYNNTVTVSNGRLVPVAVYKVGEIYSVFN